MTESYVCPSCGYPELTEPPRNSSGGSYEICPSCGFEFGVTDEDEGYSYESWRARWINLGMPWWAAPAEAVPDGWDARRQLQLLLGTDR